MVRKNRWNLACTNGKTNTLAYNKHCADTHMPKIPLVRLDALTIPGQLRRPTDADPVTALFGLQRNDYLAAMTPSNDFKHRL